MRDGEHRLASAWALAAYRATLAGFGHTEEILVMAVPSEQGGDTGGASRGLVLMELPSLVMCACICFSVHMGVVSVTFLLL